MADVPPELLPAAVVDVEVVLVVVVELEEGVEVLALPVGTVSSGAPEVSVVAELPPPQAATPVASVPPASNAATIDAPLRTVITRRG